MRAKVGITLSLILVFFVALMFNNCQPIADGLNQLNDSSSIGGPGASPGEVFFANTILPDIADQQGLCVGCHTTGFAQDRIFNYDYMLSLIQTGPFAEDNAIISRLNGTRDHAIQPCASALPALESFCEPFREWSLIEFPLQTSGIAGAIRESDLLGRITGWAIDPATPDEKIEVFIFAVAPFDDPETVPVVEIGLDLNPIPVIADQPLLGDPIGDGYAFQFQIPEALRDGQPVDLYIYGREAAEGNLLTRLPAQRAGYVPTAEGLQYFVDNIQPLLGLGDGTSCNECHNAAFLSYDVNWLRLANPSPFGDGQSDNNLLVNTLVDGGHPGGVICAGGDKTQPPCNLIQAWWGLEFGQ